MEEPGCAVRSRGDDASASPHAATKAIARLCRLYEKLALE